jgi:signal transduction histidine kinase
MVAISVGAAVAVVFISLTLVSTSSAGTRRVADNARQLHWTNGAIGTTAIVRAAVAQAVFFAVDLDIGVASQDAVDQALEEAKRAISALEAVEESADRPGETLEGPVAESLDRLAGNAGSVVELTDAGDVEAALGFLHGELEPASSAAASSLEDYRGRVQERVAANESVAGRLASLTQFLVTLLIPAIALLLYWGITRRQVREKRVEMEARLQAEQELNQAKDEFIAGLSHEFRTPLTSIYGFSEVLLESGMIDPASSIELIGLINAESSELSRMVDDLLAAARLESDAMSIKPQPVDVAVEVRSVVAPWTRSGREVEVAVTDAEVWADPLRLRQVVRNVVSNAVKHGGPRIVVWGRVERDQFVCSVIDDGDGVPDDIAGRLFERFVHDGRHALLAGSVGLGLSIARELILRMDGDLVYERINGTTCFTFRLPLAKDRVHSVPEVNTTVGLA